MGLDVLKLPEDLQASLERQGLTDLPKLKHAFHSRAEYMHDLCRKHGLRSVEVRRAVDQAESYIESTQLYGRGLKPFLPWTKRKAKPVAKPTAVEESVAESVLDSFKLAGVEGPFIYGGFGDDGLSTVQPVANEALETESSLSDIELELAVADLETDISANLSTYTEKGGLLGEIISVSEAAEIVPEELKKSGRKGKRKAAAEAQLSDSEDSSKSESD